MIKGSRCNINESAVAETRCACRGVGIEGSGSLEGLWVEKWPSYSDGFTLQGVYAFLKVYWLAGVPVLPEGGLGQLGEKGGETLALGVYHQVPDSQWMVG